MEYSDIHIIDEKTYDQLLEMIGSKEEGNAEMATEILINADTNDLNTCHFVENIALMCIFSSKPYSKKISEYYLHLKQQPNWKKVQDTHLAFYDELFSIEEELIYDYNEAGTLLNVRAKT
jgi:hypothetical protein